MQSIIKRLPVKNTILAIGFLFLQIIGSLYLPYMVADIINHGVATGDTGYIWSRGLMMIGLSIISMVGAVLNTYCFSRISYQLGCELRQDIYEKVFKFSKHEFDQFGVSSLITRSTNDVTQIQNLVEMGLKFLIISPAYLVGGIILTAMLSPRLGLIFLGTLPFLLISYLVINRFASPLYVKMQATLDQLNRHFREGLTGVKVIRAFSREEEEYQKYENTNREYTSASITASTIMSFFVPVITLLINVAALGIVWLGGLGIAGGSTPVGAVVGAISYSTQILMGFAMITNVILAIPKGQTSARRINEILEMPLSITDDNVVSLRDAGRYSLTFANVDFKYDGAQKRTLTDISFTVKGGQTMAVIGSTGDGKTSLVNLISRFYDAASGRIFLNGVDIRVISQRSIHEMVSTVPQSSVLFMGTIRSNMRLGDPDATDEQIWHALDLAQATEFIKELPDGLDSIVEKAGGNLSGGQKQRLCIARALLKKASIYVFDDSFSALDFKTDKAVRTAMKSGLKDKITVIVAQRLSTVMSADLIAVMDKGMIVGLGTHEELKQSCPVYQEIIDSQTYQEELPGTFPEQRKEAV